MAAPEVQALAREMAGQALVLKVDTEAQPELAARFRIQSIPNFVVLQNAQTVFQQAGLVPRQQIETRREYRLVARSPDQLSVGEIRSHLNARMDHDPE